MSKVSATSAELACATNRGSAAPRSAPKLIAARSAKDALYMIILHKEAGVSRRIRGFRKIVALQKHWHGFGSLSATYQRI
ncbi:MAG: hypothetical protein L6Q76_35550 [Polyangiaceae bacterium]|nr:hypothetical protein [Polyangiaceae bacterium]